MHLILTLLVNAVDYMSHLPQMELILAVGLKLSTKSDIKLPRS